jgi:hypothetical protein
MGLRLFGRRMQGPLSARYAVHNKQVLFEKVCIFLKPPGHPSLGFFSLQHSGTLEKRAKALPTLIRA